MKPLPRRAILAAPVLFAAQAKPAITASTVIERIRQNVGVPWRAETVDKLVFGESTTEIKGIAVTMMATLEMLQKAAKAGHNLIVTHEPTFYSHQDATADLQQDELFLHKTAFMKQHNLTVFHFHDHWHARKPDGIAIGMQQALGWQAFAAADNPKSFAFPKAKPLAALVKEMETKLHAGSVRVVGDPGMPVRNALASWGYSSGTPAMRLIARPEVDALIVGETREWELIEYAQDLVAAGRRKALIVLGHIASEQEGMRNCAEWLRGFVTEVPVEFIASAEPFQRRG